MNAWSSSLVVAVLGAVAVIVWRIQESRRAVSMRSILIPPLGMATGFTQGQTYNFTIFTANNITGFSTDKFLFDTTGFSTNVGPNAIFSISQSGNDLILSFTPVPEPSTWALLGTGVLAIGPVGWRQRKRA